MSTTHTIPWYEARKAPFEAFGILYYPLFAHRADLEGIELDGEDMTWAVTANTNDGSPARSAVGDATGVNSTAKAPSSSVVASPFATKSSPSSGPSPPPPNQPQRRQKRHQSG